MKIVGICGNSGSGKSTVCRILKERMIPILDCDVIYHDLVCQRSDCLNEIENRFGKEVVNGDVLDRAALKNIVFQDESARQDLNRITHRYVISELKHRIEELEWRGAEICVIDAPLFFEAGLDTWCDLVCAVVADEKEQIRRIMNRDRITEKEAKIRLSKQISADVLRSRSDFVIENNGSELDLKLACDELLKRL